MRILYWDCSMGASGDMLAASLLDLNLDPKEAEKKLNALSIPGIVFQIEEAERCGICGLRFRVLIQGKEENSEGNPEEIQEHEHDHRHKVENHFHEDLLTPEGMKQHSHSHHTFSDIQRIVSGFHLPDSVKEDVLSVYQLLAEAEGHVHGKPMENIHFHEVGTLDAIADITAVCFLIGEIKPDRIVASPIQLGNGQVHCAHGILPVPAPATAWLLREVPSYGGTIQEELCTPTGAALLKYFVQDFGRQPLMKTERIGYGCGKRNLVQANCVRAFLGETNEETETVLEVSCNLDDMTPETVGYAMEQLFKVGALDVYTLPSGMKKNRPGVLLQCLCREKERDEIIRQIFAHTTTLGVREAVYKRVTLSRSVRTVETKWGPVRIKEASGWGVTRRKPEYEDVKKIADQTGLSFMQITEELLQKKEKDGTERESL